MSEEKKQGEKNTGFGECEDIRERLYALQDREYARFQAKLIPTVPAERIIGVRTPHLRTMAKQIKKEGKGALFLQTLPHAFFDEDQLHAFLISEEKEFTKCAAEVDRFLPYIDNWATCDQLSPGIFGKHPDELLPYIKKWLASERVYTVRFAICMLMRHYLGARFDAAFPEWVAGIESAEYYVNMMIAWYFATALDKQYEAAVPYLEKGLLGEWTHNKAIQKGIESRRISEERKAYLRSLKRRETSVQRK